MEPKTDLIVEVLSADMMGQLDVFWHYGGVFCMDSTQVGVFQEASQIISCCFLQHHDCTHLEVQIIPFTFLGYFTNEMHKGALANEELGAYLVSADLTETHHPQPVPLGFLDEPSFLQKFFTGGLSSYCGHHMCSPHCHLHQLQGQWQPGWPSCLLQPPFLLSSPHQLILPRGCPQLGPLPPACPCWYLCSCQSELEKQPIREHDRLFLRLHVVF